MKISKILLPLILFFSIIEAKLVKNLGTFNNDRPNYLYGVGLVTGLSGTGDKSKSTQELAFNYLNPNQLGLDKADFKTKNTAMVSLSGTLPAYSRIGDRININVQTLGDAKSLENGTLLLAFLRGQDKEVYASCQGNITTNKSITNGRIINGCIIEKELDYSINNITNLTFKLFQKDLSNILKIKNRINQHFGIEIAKAIDARNIEIEKIPTLDNMDLIEQIFNLDIDYIERKKVIINFGKELISADKGIPVKPITIDTVDFTLSFDSLKKNENINPGDQNVGDNVTINVDRGLMYREGTNIFLHDIVRILKILKVDFQEMYNIVKSLKENNKFDADLKEEY